MKDDRDELLARDEIQRKLLKEVSGHFEHVVPFISAHF